MVWWPRHTVGSIRLLFSTPPQSSFCTASPARASVRKAEWRNTRRSVSGLGRAGPTVLCYHPAHAHRYPPTPPVVAGRRLRRRVPIAIFLPKASSLQSPARSAAAPSPYFSMPRLKPRTRATVLSAKVMYVHRTRPPPSLPVLYRHIVTGPRRHPATDVRCPPRWFVLCARAAAFNPPAVVML